MGKKKQKKNEKKYMKPAKKRLKSFWADVFGIVFRGKQRGNGLMIHKDRIKDLESEVSSRVKSLGKEFTDQYKQRNNIPEDQSLGGFSEYWDMQESGKYSEFNDKKEKYIRLNALTKIRKLAYAVQVANEIKTTDRGSWVSANNLFSSSTKVTETGQVMAAHNVFRKLRTNSNWTPKKVSEAREPSWLSKSYGGSKDKNERSIKLQREMFLSGEL